MGKLKMVVLTNHMLTGVCVSVCDTGFWSDTVVLCFGPNYPWCVLLCTKSQERERERVRPGESPFPEQKRRDQPTQYCLP